MEKYELLLDITKQNLQALLRIVDKAERHVKEKEIEEKELLGAKLYPDMLDFTKQIQISSDYGRKNLAYLCGKEPVKMEDTETTIAELKERIQKSLDVVETFKSEDFTHADEQEVRLFWFKGTHMLGKDFLTSFGISNFLFHVVTAYDILRAQGVPLGKGDFLGEINMRPDAA